MVVPKIGLYRLVGGAGGAPLRARYFIFSFLAIGMTLEQTWETGYHIMKHISLIKNLLTVKYLMNGVPYFIDGIAQSLQRLGTGWTANWSDFECR
jgi:hypothetical protein